MKVSNGIPFKAGMQLISLAPGKWLTAYQESQPEQLEERSVNHEILGVKVGRERHGDITSNIFISMY